MKNGILAAMKRKAGVWLAGAVFAVLYAVYHAHHPNGFSMPLLGQNANESLALILAAMAQTAPILTGGIDLSVGAVMTLCNCLASHLLAGGPWQIALGVLLCLLAGAAFGAMNGAIVVFGRIQPIIATLATGAVALGLALLLRPYPGGEVDENLAWVLTGKLADLFAGTDAFGLIGQIPTPLLLLSAVALFWLPFQRTVTGRTIFAVGSSENAAYMSGLPVVRAKLAAFTVSGLLAACAGVFIALQTLSGNADLPQAGTYTLSSIAAVVIGGTALSGGVGGLLGSVLGALILRVIAFNFRIFEIDPLIQPLVEGAVLLLAISLSATRLLRIKNRLDLFS